MRPQVPQEPPDRGWHSGTGPGPIARDGSAADFYAASPPADDVADLVHSALSPGAAILELGAGAGRVTHPLLARGHPVVAVDESAEMLRHVRGADVVISRIEDLDLARTFDCVLLGSYIIEMAPERASRLSLLGSCRRHVAPSGTVIMQRQPPSWYETVRPRVWERDGTRFRLSRVDRIADGVIRADLCYRIGERSWTHSFTSWRLDDDELTDLLDTAGMRLVRFLDPDQGWIVAAPRVTG